MILHFSWKCWLNGMVFANNKVTVLLLWTCLCVTPHAYQVQIWSELRKPSGGILISEKISSFIFCCYYNNEAVISIQVEPELLFRIFLQGNLRFNSDSDELTGELRDFIFFPVHFIKKTVEFMFFFWYNYYR